ncbi:hypothetical protein Pelo_15659 [Pelomyxa schiedti]|nr:hypothetical protein Pelo_15659 [Pelomyxa schiedti]
MGVIDVLGIGGRSNIEVFDPVGMTFAEEEVVGLGKHNGYIWICRGTKWAVLYKMFDDVGRVEVRPLGFTCNAWFSTLNGTNLLFHKVDNTHFAEEDRSSNTLSVFSTDDFETPLCIFAINGKFNDWHLAVAPAIPLYASVYVAFANVGILTQ